MAISEKERPTLIIGHTIMARGAVAADGSSAEGWVSTHGQPLSKAGVDLEATIRNLGGNPDDPWEIREDVAQLYDDRRKALEIMCAQRHEEEKQWAEQNPEAAATLKAWEKGELPELNWDEITIKSGSATRAASAAVLGYLAEHIGNMIVSSADLANSDKTDGFLKKTKALIRGDFSGAFLQAGVAELTMACIINGIILHGAMRGACATFFVFSDYMKPAIRMAALMELPALYIFSHDAFRVGEDGPTHQPVEQEAQIRLLEQMKNLSGKRAALVLRPADAAETVECYRLALTNNDSPSVMILSRQDIPEIPIFDRRDQAKNAEQGAYLVISSPCPDVTLVANGSEVSLLCEVATMLANDGIKANVVSAPSIGLFMDQPGQYRDSVIIPGVPVFGLTAGLPSTLWPITLGRGEVFGLERFGASAPFKVLDEKFGFSAENISKKIKDFLQK